MKELAITEQDITGLKEMISAAPQVKADFSRFCETWPSIKEGLILLAKIASLIPGIGYFVKKAIEIVIELGDLVYKMKCE